MMKLQTPRLPAWSTRTLMGFGLATLALQAAHAVENGSPITPPGVYDFGAGLLPPPTEFGTVGVRAAATRATDLRDNAGQRSAATPDLKVNSYSMAYIRMTEHMVGSARYGWGGVVPVLDMSMNLSVPTPVGPVGLSGKNQAVGDVQLIPVILQWVHGPGLFSNFQLAAQLPTGSYDKNRLINAGTNHATLSPSWAFTWIQPGGFEVSSWFQLNFNQRNKDTNYRSGTEYEHDFAVGQHFGPWTVGMGGYLYQQISDDVAPGLSNGNRSRALALGPALTYFQPGSGLPLVSMHFYRETEVRNRTQGTSAAIRLGWSF